MIRLLLMVLMAAACYPVCATDFDCKNGYCQIDHTPDGEKRSCIACDPSGRPCLDGQICAGFNMCVPCQTSDECGDGSECSEGVCVELMIMPSDDAGETD